MDEQQYVADNALSYTYQDGLYVLTHPGWLGLIAPGGVQGTGETGWRKWTCRSEVSAPTVC